jgi:LEA14-like dessication related protein
MKYTRFISLFSTILLLSSCTEWKDVTITKIDQMRVAKMDKDGLDAEIDVTINNPNKMGFTIFKSNVDVKMNDVSVGVAKLKKRIHVKANAEAKYTFLISSKFDDLLSSGGIFGLISSVMSKSANVTLKGDLKVGKIFYRKNFPIDNKQRIPLLK